MVSSAILQIRKKLLVKRREDWQAHNNGQCCHRKEKCGYSKWKKCLVTNQHTIWGAVNVIGRSLEP
jgi:hypothetical protein